MLPCKVHKEQLDMTVGCKKLVMNKLSRYNNEFPSNPHACILFTYCNKLN
jgi:hypothetical protein